MHVYVKFPDVSHFILRCVTNNLTENNHTLMIYILYKYLFKHNHRNRRVSIYTLSRMENPFKQTHYSLCCCICNCACATVKMGSLPKLIKFMQLPVQNTNLSTNHTPQFFTYYIYTMNITTPHHPQNNNNNFFYISLLIK